MAAQACLWLLVAGMSPLGAAEPGGRAEYVGGTVAVLAGTARGEILTTGQQYFEFRARPATLRIAYEKINLLEYGQKVDRRYALGILVSPVLLLSKKRRHFLTIGYADEEGRQQAVVFQVDKNHVRSVLAGLEARTGRRVEYQDEEARKAGKG